MTVYPDLAFLLGMVLHGAIFWLTLLLLDLRRPRWIFWVATLCSGISSAIYLLAQIPVLIPIIIGILSFLFLFWGKSFIGTLWNMLTGYGILILYLGVFIIVCGGIFRFSFVFFEFGGYFMLSFFQSLFSAFFSFGLCLIFVRIRKKQKGKIYCNCSMCVEGISVSFRAYVDTGNFLTDPVSGFPVVVLEFPLLRKTFGNDFPLPMTYEFAERFSSRVRVIPYRSVSGGGQMLSGFVPESFTVNGVPRKVVVAVSDRNLECRGRFSGIIGSNLLGGE